MKNKIKEKIKNKIKSIRYLNVLYAILIFFMAGATSVLLAVIHRRPEDMYYYNLAAGLIGCVTFTACEISKEQHTELLEAINKNTVN
ncbi:MAG: hypothetical protein K2N73_15715 [Lachnospiraceae bacterium]|nr:hypothetical protein [Lachnospiraceae bacterium]